MDYGYLIALVIHVFFVHFIVLLNLLIAMVIVELCAFYMCAPVDFFSLSTSMLKQINRIINAVFA